MEPRPRILKFFKNHRGTPFTEWMESLESEDIHATILVRLDRVEDGNLGDCKFEGDGVYELRFNVGPGWRVYFGQTGD